MCPDPPELLAFLNAVLIFFVFFWGGGGRFSFLFQRLWGFRKMKKPCSFGGFPLFCFFFSKMQGLEGQGGVTTELLFSLSVSLSLSLSFSPCLSLSNG